ncbi:DUF6518 family protein [Plantibacter sp. YIM 135249]|uniref:DUF6518 family protein n=1 Tax=Plantibacter sp. YIM 135249 TaxID=3423918 RepID=UPI003D3544CB
MPQRASPRSAFGAEPRTPDSTPRTPDSTPRALLIALTGALAIALAGGLALGGLTSFGQQYLPDWLRPLANSAGGWTMFAFVLVWLGRTRPAVAAILGLIAFEALVFGYGIVSTARGYDFNALASFWTLAGVVVGPVVGAAAGLLRYGTPMWRILAVTPLCAVLLGEGIHSLQTIADTTGSTYWIIEIVLSVLFFSVAATRLRPRPRHLGIAIAVWVIGAASYIGAWALLGGGVPF